MHGVWSSEHMLSTVGKDHTQCLDIRTQTQYSKERPCTMSDSHTIGWNSTAGKDHAQCLVIRTQTQYSREGPCTMSYYHNAGTVQ